MRRRFGLLLAAALLGAAMLPASAAAAPGGNLGHQGTKNAPITVHCWWDSNGEYETDVYEVLWTVAPDVNVQLGDGGGEGGGFLIWAAASGKYSAPSVLIGDTGYYEDQTFYESLFAGPDWPAGYITVQAVRFNLDYSVTVIASGTARCQKADIEVN